MVAELFNDILGPLMIGPSSSHTAAPARIGHMAHDISGRAIIQAEIIVSKRGSYAATCRSQGVDRGFAAGLLGLDASDPQLVDSLTLCEQKGLEVVFRFTSDELPHPNYAILKIRTRDQNQVTIDSVSLGGGSIKITSIDSVPVDLDGGCHVILAWRMPGSTPLSTPLNFRKFQGNQVELWVHESCNAPGAALISQVLQAQGTLRVAHVRPVLPIPCAHGSPSFSTATSMQQALRDETELWQAALLYERQVSRLTEEEILHKMNLILDVMEKSVHDGIHNPSSQFFSYLKPSSCSMEKARIAGKFIPSGILERATVIATAVMESDRSMRGVVAAPTAGSCGVLPAILLSARDEMKFSKDDIIKALLAAALIGAFIANQATFAAELAGCQAENGSASAMAAAALAQLMGCNLADCLKAAALALQNLIGLACDPVACSVEIPCISRNVVAVANAVVSANMVIGGFDPFIPLDECIQAVMETGHLMPSELRCTGRGGLAATPTAQRFHFG